MEASTGQALGTALGEGKWPEGSQRCSGPDSEPPLHTRPPGSWNLEGLRVLGHLASYISPGLWMQLQEVGQCPRRGDSGERGSSQHSTSLSRPEGWPAATLIPKWCPQSFPIMEFLSEGKEKGTSGPPQGVDSPGPPARPWAWTSSAA